MGGHYGTESITTKANQDGDENVRKATLKEGILGSDQGWSAAEDQLGTDEKVRAAKTAVGSSVESLVESIATRSTGTKTGISSAIQK